MARKESYSRVYRWLNRRLVDVGATANERAVLCAYLEWQEPGKPLGVHTFRGREYFTTASDVAGVLGFSEATVKKALSGLCKKGVIARISKGHKGCVARYEVVQRVPDSEPYSDAQRVPDTEPYVENSQRVPDMEPYEAQRVPDTEPYSPSKGTEIGTHLKKKNEKGSDALHARRVAPVPEGTKEAPGEPGPLDTETLREAWAAFVAGRDLTPGQEATHARYARSRTWEDIRAGRYRGAEMRTNEV